MKVFEPGDTLPQSAEVLGSISIRDRGNSVHCKYDEIIKLGQDKTAELGGNALGISLHTPPSFWGSSCHQIEGHILLLNDPGKHYSLAERNDLDATLKANKYNQKEKKEQASMNKNTISLFGGISSNNSEIYNNDGQKIGTLVGAGFQLAYQHIFSRWAGIGVVADYGTGSKSHTGHKTEYRHFYFAPEYIFPIYIGKKFNWIYGLGMGYGNVNIFNENYHRFGLHLQTTLSYQLAKHWGVAFRGIIINSTMPDELKPDEESRSRFNRSNFLLGVQYHF